MLLVLIGRPSIASPGGVLVLGIKGMKVTHCCSSSIIVAFSSCEWCCRGINRQVYCLFEALCDSFVLCPFSDRLGASAGFVGAKTNQSVESLRHNGACCHQYARFFKMSFSCIDGNLILGPQPRLRSRSQIQTQQIQPTPRARAQWSFPF